ncbi:MAG: hypothetical protein LBC41_07780, partial [Clostridiales bacterium]|nr:hypothetical protein [Clostridiales bacterium]
MDAILKLAYPAQTEEQKEKYSCFFELESIAPGFEPEITYDNDGFRIMLTYYDCELLGQYVDGELVIEASTSIGGPGYHACLVDIFDGLGVKPIRVEDPTGYYEHRDFAKLQDAMDEWLKDVSASVLQLHRNGGKNIGVSYNPHTTPEESDHFAFCPLGYFEKEFFERAANGERLGKDFFVWWNKEPDALYCCQVAMNLIWWQVIWIKPVSETEEEVLSSVLTCLEKA